MSRNKNIRLVGLVIIALLVVVAALSGTTSPGPVDAQGGGKQVSLRERTGNWEAAPAVPAAVSCVGGLQHDDNITDNGYGFNPGVVTDGAYVEFFTTPTDPFQLTQACICWAHGTGADSSISYDLVIYAANGPGGDPGTLVATYPVTASGVTVGLPGVIYDYPVNATITGGAFYVGARWNPTAEVDFFVCSDESATTPLQGGKTTSNGGASWSDIFPFFTNYRSMIIRAEGLAGEALFVTAQCSGDNLQINIVTGDPSFTIAGAGGGLPITTPTKGIKTIAGPGTWSSLSVTENGGNFQTQFLPDIFCPSLGTTGVPGIGVPHLGLVRIDATQAQPAYGIPAGELAYTAAGGEIWLPRDFDGNGFDTYVVTDVVIEPDGRIWIGLFMGVDEWLWVPLDQVSEIIPVQIPD